MELLLIIVTIVITVATFTIVYALVDRMPVFPGLPRQSTSRETALCESEKSEYCTS